MLNESFDAFLLRQRVSVRDDRGLVHLGEKMEGRNGICCRESISELAAFLTERGAVDLTEPVIEHAIAEHLDAMRPLF